MRLLTRWLKLGEIGIFTLLLAWSTRVLAEPVSIEQAVNLSLNHNLDIKIAENSKEQAEFSLQSTEGSRGISLDASNTFYAKQINSTHTPSASSLTVSLPLYSGGKNEGNIDMARTDVAMAELALTKTIQDIKLKTISAYFDVIEARKIQAVDQETVDNYKLHLDNVNAQFSAGNIAKADVLRSEVELADAQQILLKAQNSYEDAVNILKNVIRWKTSAEPEFTDDFLNVPESRSMEECVTVAKQHRPDLGKYRLAVDKARKNVDVARADKKPSISLAASTGWNSTVLPDDENRQVSVGVTTSWNLFDSNITNANIKKAQSAVDAALLELASQEDSAELSVKQDYLGMKEAEKRRETTQVAVHKAEEDYFIAEAKYRVGEGVILDVIDAQLALTTAKQNYVEAQYDYATYKAKLENDMGMN